MSLSQQSKPMAIALSATDWKAIQTCVGDYCKTRDTKWNEWANSFISLIEKAIQQPSVLSNEQQGIVSVNLDLQTLETVQVCIRYYCQKAQNPNWLRWGQYVNQKIKEIYQSDTVFCLSCGKENVATASVCIQCNTPILTIPLPVVTRLISLARGDNNQETRKAAIHELGRLKVRQAIPVLLEIANLKGFKRVDELSAAKYALTQIFDLSVSYLTCSICGNDNTTTAKFCGYCGTPLTHPSVTEQEFKGLIAQVQNYSNVFPLQAVKRLGQIQHRAAVPALLNLYRQLTKGLTDKFELLIVLEALADIGDPAAVKDISKTARRWRTIKLFPVAASCVQALYRLGERDEVDGHLRVAIDPDSEDVYGGNLLYILMYGKILSNTKQISGLTSQITIEHKKWKPRIGFTFLAFDPVTLIMSTVITSVSILFQSGLIRHDNQRAKTLASWMVTPAELNPDKFAELPHQVRLMTALHCYSTAFAILALRDRDSVLSEFQKCKNSIAQAVISLALAQNGDTSVSTILKKLSEDNDWAVRILAYEATIALNDTSGALRALQDRDLQVRIAVAQSMVNCGNAVYIPYILALPGSTDQKQRQAIVPVIAQLVQIGVPAAEAKLQELANNDSDKKVRELAHIYINQLKT